MAEAIGGKHSRSKNKGEGRVALAVEGGVFSMGCRLLLDTVDLRDMSARSLARERSR